MGLEKGKKVKIFELFNRCEKTLQAAKRPVSRRIEERKGGKTEYKTRKKKKPKKKKVTAPITLNGKKAGPK